MIRKQFGVSFHAYGSLLIEADSEDDALKRVEQLLDKGKTSVFLDIIAEDGTNNIEIGEVFEEYDEEIDEESDS